MGKENRRGRDRGGASGEGGLGGAVAEVLAKHCPRPIEFVGMQDTFGESGSPAELVERYGLGADAIESAAKKVLRRK